MICQSNTMTSSRVSCPVGQTRCKGNDAQLYLDVCVGTMLLFERPRYLAGVVISDKPGRTSASLVFSRCTGGHEDRHLRHEMVLIYVFEPHAKAFYSWMQFMNGSYVSHSGSAKGKVQLPRRYSDVRRSGQFGKYGRHTKRIYSSATV